MFDFRRYIPFALVAAALALWPAACSTSSSSPAVSTKVGSACNGPPDCSGDLFCYSGTATALRGTCTVGCSSGAGGSDSCKSIDPNTTCIGAGICARECGSGQSCLEGTTCHADDGYCQHFSATTPPASDDASVDASGDDDRPIDAPSPDAAIADAGGDSASHACRPGAYTGPWDGTYWGAYSFGDALAAHGNVTFNLVPAGPAGTSCIVGNASRDCDGLFVIGDGGATAFSTSTPGTYFLELSCTLSGSLDCAAKKLVDGWVQCRDCTTLDGGACGSVGTSSAGTLTADFDPGTQTFVSGQWNAAEALGGNDGHSPGPDGGAPSDYLPDGGVYGFSPDGGLARFGNSGTWNTVAE